MGQVTVARALATLLERMGTEYVFGVNGHGNWALLDAVVHETTITGIPARAEDQALQMADGYWREPAAGAPPGRGGKQPASNPIPPLSPPPPLSRSPPPRRRRSRAPRPAPRTRRSRWRMATGGCGGRRRSRASGRAAAPGTRTPRPRPPPRAP